MVDCNESMKTLLRHHALSYLNFVRETLCVAFNEINVTIMLGYNKAL